jgi:predicted membrane protein
MENHYAPPRANLDQAKNDQPTGLRGWFSSRPIPVYLIFCLSVLQIAGIAIFTYEGRHIVSNMIETGAMSPVEFFGGLVFPMLYMVAGILLLLLRKIAAYAFSVYFVWGLGKYFGLSQSAPTIFDLILTTCIVAYCWQLYRKGRLK